MGVRTDEGFRGAGVEDAVGVAPAGEEGGGLVKLGGNGGEAEEVLPGGGAHGRQLLEWLGADAVGDEGEELLEPREPLLRRQLKV